MISRERLRQKRRFARRRNVRQIAIERWLFEEEIEPKRLYLMLNCWDLGRRACSCPLCDVHKLEPNKSRRRKEKRKFKREIEEEL